MTVYLASYMQLATQQKQAGGTAGSNAGCTKFPKASLHAAVFSVMQYVDVDNNMKMTIIEITKMKIVY